MHDFALLFDKDGEPLNSQFLEYDPVSDSGINVGYNEHEQTVGAGESKRYLWHADREYGACILQSFADIRNHRYHGLFGAVIVEPAGAKWYRNFTNRKDSYAEQAVITAPGIESFREFVLFIQNGIRLLDVNGNLIQTAAEDNGEPVDAEDTGVKGYNYRSERFANRLARDPRTWKVFSSKVHGDPAFFKHALACHTNFLNIIQNVTVSCILNLSSLHVVSKTLWCIMERKSAPWSF